MIISFEDRFQSKLYFLDLLQDRHMLPLIGVATVIEPSSFYTILRTQPFFYFGIQCF